jgi:hypothetical protein
VWGSDSPILYAKLLVAQPLYHFYSNYRMSLPHCTANRQRSDYPEAFCDAGLTASCGSTGCMKRLEDHSAICHQNDGAGSEFSATTFVAVRPHRPTTGRTFGHDFTHQGLTIQVQKLQSVRDS